MAYKKVVDVMDSIRGGRFVRYDGPIYQVGVTLHESGFVQLNIYLRQEAPKFSPNLFVEEGRGYLPKGIKVETTSYGTLGVEDTRIFCRQMEEAVSAAESIQKAFIRKRQILPHLARTQEK